MLNFKSHNVERDNLKTLLTLHLLKRRTKGKWETVTYKAIANLGGRKCIKYLNHVISQTEILENWDTKKGKKRNCIKTQRRLCIGNPLSEY